MKNQIGAYGSVIVGILLLLVFCDVSTMSHLHVRSVMFPNYPRQTLLANFDAQNADKIGLSHYWPNGQADTTLSLKSFMNLQRKGLSSGDLPEYALFNNIRFADEISSNDLRGAISREYLVLDSGSLKTEIIKSQINENQTGRNDLAGDVILKHRTYTMTQLKVSSNEDAFLFVRDGYHPFWKASVNGLEEKVFRAMENYKAIAIPKGESVVQFHFQPTGIPLSIAIAYAIIIVTAALWIRSALSGSDQSHNAVLYD
jgi:hypothetical protein